MTRIKTSSSDPLRIAAAPAGSPGGQIGITFCPGKQGSSNEGHVWQRDLGMDLDIIAAWGPAAIVTLLEDSEFAMLGVPELGAQIQSRGIEWHHLPIQDVKPPDTRFEQGWLRSGPMLLAHLQAGKRVLVHCRGGLGRAGTVAARLLVELGASPADAIGRVRQVRPGAIETRQQEDYVLGLTALAPRSPAQAKPAGGIPARRDSRGDWFEQLTGFVESQGPAGYEATRNQLEVDGHHLRSRVNGRQFGIGSLELVSLQSLRQRALAGAPIAGQRSFRLVQGNVRALHSQPEYAGALFQVASQFNLLEMVGPSVTPEDGVTRYAGDPTQGPACAIAAGAATVYRNYFAQVGDAVGQTADRQLDGFADLGAAVAQGLGLTADKLWTMTNGYAMFGAKGIDLMSGHVQELDERQRDALRQLLKIGVHWDVEVTDGVASPGPQVSQAFCSALPVAYARVDRGANWAPLASLVLEAAYEATLWAAVINAQRGASRRVLLTSLGGGAFGNDESWIRAAMRRAVQAVAGHGLDIVLVSYKAPSAELQQWVGAFQDLPPAS